VGEIDEQRPDPGPLRAFGQRVRARRNNKIATVAVARKRHNPRGSHTRHPRPSGPPNAKPH
jgi:hypothetical protein